MFCKKTGSQGIKIVNIKSDKTFRDIYRRKTEIRTKTKDDDVLSISKPHGGVLLWQ